MPLTVYGDNTAPIVLYNDIGKPKPRTLRAKFLSKKDIRLWQKKVAAAKEIDDVDQRDDAYEAALAEVITGWENIPGDFAVAAIAEHYTLPEYMAILEMIPMGMVPGADDAKKSELAAK